MNIARYRKAIVAVLAAAAVAAQAAVSDGVITRDEWWKIALAAAGAVGVFGLRNATPPPAVAPTLFAGRPVVEDVPRPQRRPRE